MTRRIGSIFLIQEEKPQQCDMCGKIDELRPYGPPGAKMICFPCGMKDPTNTFMAYARAWSEGMEDQEEFLAYVKQRMGNGEPGSLSDELATFAAEHQRREET